VAAQTASPAPAAQATLARIAGHLDRRDLEAARREVGVALAAHPQDGVLHDFAGIVAAQAGDRAAAERHFLEAIRLSPGLRSAYANLGRLYQEQGSDAAADQAIAVYRRLLSFAPEEADTRYQAAWLLARAGRFAEARTLAGRLPAAARQRPQVLALEAAIAAGLGERAAVAAAVRALEAHPGLDPADIDGVLPALAQAADGQAARLVLEAADRRDRASVEARRRLAQIHLRDGQPDAARRTLERAAAAATPSVALLGDLARAAYAARDLTGTLGYLARAREMAPDDAGLHFFFGIVCIEQNLGREARESLLRAVALDPDNPYINYALGAVSLHGHEPTDALPYFEAYRRLRPDDPRGLFALGAARFYGGQLEEARRDLEQAAARPETAAGAWYFLGRIARQLNDLAAARSALERALSLNASHADAWAELGLVQLREGAHREAAASLARAIALEPDNYAAAVNLAALYGRTKDGRREAQEARVRPLQEQRERRAQEFLRIVQVVP
jgi:tetratricopeptide (TPR) repeat protein